MALPASAITPPSHRVMLFKTLSCQYHILVVKSRVLFCPTSAASNSWKPTRMELSSHAPCDPPRFKVPLDYAMKKLQEVIPDSVQKRIKVPLDYATKKLQEVIPDSVQNFPWAEAESAVTKWLLTLLRETLKWSLVALSALSFVSDIIDAFSINKELVIPFGLLCGCVAAEFLKETSRELLHLYQGRFENWRFLGMGLIFVLIRMLVVRCSTEPPALLLHAANGGLLHVLWQWKSSSDNGDSRTNVTSEEETSSSQSVENYVG